MVGPVVMLGKWKLVESENFDDYMKALGVGMIVRNMANLASPTVEITKTDEETWKLVTSATFKTTELQFKLDGKSFNETTGDGRKVATTITWDDSGVLTQNQVGCDNCKGSVMTRTFKDDEMTLILKCGDAVSTRVYKKLDA